MLASLLGFGFSLSLCLMTWLWVQQDGVVVCISLVVPLLDTSFIGCSLMLLRLHLIFGKKVIL